MKALVEGGFKEATERSVEWDDVNEQTFVSFWQFVYSGDYETPEQLLPPESGPTASHTKADRFDAQSGVCSRPEQSEPEVLEPDQEGLIQPFEVESWGFIASSNKCCKKCKCCKKKKPHQWYEDTVVKEEIPYTGIKRRTNKEMLWDDFVRSWRMDLSVFTKKDTFDTGGGPGVDTLIHHGRVYVLADRYGIGRLMDVSLQKLHQALVKSKVPETNLNDIVAMVRFCYAELVPERLRRLVVHYISCNLETLWKIKEFQELVEDYGNLARALVGSMLLRLD